MGRRICAAATALVLCFLYLPSSATTAQASPEDPFGEDWIALAISPEAGIGTYGAAGNPDQATQIALDECNQRSNGRRCVLATATQYGCVAYTLNTVTQAWAGGRGPNLDAAILDARSKMPSFGENEVVAGGQCSNPTTPP
ncbi:DUF4189 domain-containing protein [Mycobacterium sp. CVI_P3]|uniref:DUF4189 domain-containing protein n=1 Tax=Mycobacterium pinniadriaticum TaxID=2994102 RepID=A0ABT3SEF6_9MYCO|nr:DUF4189 domain-containing protein [Mycobacterium pinniadriaticum]MCX2931343.1 DUF4189 domain-containing protein [Mycobacterium pinniadriaticum]MCX2937767.1 DUF4189 domain-containing protein [Mycobacterium pinniadriaticum]